VTRTPLSRSKDHRSTCRGGAYCGGLPHSLLKAIIIIIQTFVRRTLSASELNLRLWINNTGNKSWVSGRAVYNDVISRGACKCQVLRTPVCYWQRQTADAYGSLDDPCLIKCRPTVSNPHVCAMPALEYPQHVKVRQTVVVDMLCWFTAERAIGNFLSAVVSIFICWERWLVFFGGFIPVLLSRTGGWTTRT